MVNEVWAQPRLAGSHVAYEFFNVSVSGILELPQSYREEGVVWRDPHLA